MATMIAKSDGHDVFVAIGRSSYFRFLADAALKRHRCSASVFDSEFAEDLVEMVLHGMRADPKDDGNLLVRLALTHPLRRPRCSRGLRSILQSGHPSRLVRPRAKESNPPADGV